jgi:hypothetical protein
MEPPREEIMPRYLIERLGTERLAIPDDTQGSWIVLIFTEKNNHAGVTWIRSYIAPDGFKSFCIYDAPTPEAIRHAARENNLPVDRITEVQVIDPPLLYEIASA